MEGRVTIIGLGSKGCSMGLSLREHEPDVEVIGHDIDPERAHKARQIGAVDKTHWNLPAACEGAQLVILTLPMPAVRETLEVIGPHLEESCVVTDTAPLKEPVLAWAQEHLPAHVHFVTGMPIPDPEVDRKAALSGPDAADPDLYLDGLYCVTPTPETDPQGVSVLLDLAASLGAQPFFLSPQEFDGLQAGATDLPALVAVALLEATVDSPGWVEMRKLAGRGFATVTRPAATDPAGRQEAARLNRENLVRRLDMLIEQLAQLRTWLQEDDAPQLEAAYLRASEARARWLRERVEEDGKRPSVTGQLSGLGQQLQQMLFGDFFRRGMQQEDE
jgi:prephenate dehydrogenase